MNNAFPELGQCAVDQCTNPATSNFIQRGHAIARICTLHDEHFRANTCEGWTLRTTTFPATPATILYPPGAPLPPFPP